MLICPNYTSGKVIKNDKTYYGKHNHKCKDCHRQFIAENAHHITDRRRQDVTALLLKQISMRGISRSMGVSMGWLMPFAEEVWGKASDDLGANYSWLDMFPEKQFQSIELQVDEIVC